MVFMMVSDPDTGKSTPPIKKSRTRRFIISFTTHSMAILAGLGIGGYINMETTVQKFRKAAIEEAVKSALSPQSVVCTGTHTATGKKVTVSIIEDKAFRFRFSTMTIVVLPEGETIPAQFARKRGIAEGEIKFRERVKADAFKICGKASPKF